MLVESESMVAEVTAADIALTLLFIIGNPVTTPADDTAALKAGVDPNTPTVDCNEFNIVVICVVNDCTI